jgi:pimeloyl-ACP methyl ester carboxylesterase
VSRRHPEWRYVELAGVGHVPQLQVPEQLAAEVLAWLRTSGLSSRDAPPAARS